MNKKLLIACVVSLVASAGQVQAATIGWTTSGGSANAGFNGTVGHSLIVNSTINVDSLGVFDHLGDGLESGSAVGLWSELGALLASAEVPAGTGGTLIDRYRFTSITPITLSPGTYRLGAVLRDAAAYRVESALVTTTPEVTIDLTEGWYDLNLNDLEFPNIPILSTTPGLIALDSANLTFTTVPEPTSALFLCGTGALACLRRRRRTQPA